MTASESAATGRLASCQYDATLPSFITASHPSPACLNLLNIKVGIKLWGPKIANSVVTLLCDNEQAVAAIQTARTRDENLLSQARDLWVSAASHGIHIIPKLASCKLVAQHMQAPAQSMLTELNEYLFKTQITL